MSTFIHDGLPGSSFAERPQARRRAPNTIYVKISPSDNKDKHTTSSSEGKRGLGDWGNGESTLKNGVRTSRRLIFTSTLVLALVLALALLLFFSGSASSEPLALPENLRWWWWWWFCDTGSQRNHPLLPVLVWHLPLRAGSTPG